MRYVIIGAGITGVEAALEIRRRDAEGAISIVDKENEAKGKGCIFRPALKEYLSGSVPEDDLSVYPENYLHDQGIEFIHANVSSIDSQTNTIEITPIDQNDSPRTLPYDRLLIATGAVPNTPAFFSHDPSPVNLFTFKTLKDASSVRSWIEHHRGTCLVVGGGILGMETAELLNAIGLKVILVTRSNNRLFAGIPETLKRKVIELFERKGIRSLLMGDVQEITIEDDRYSGLQLKNGDAILLDTMILCAGVKPSPILPEKAGLEFSRGIHVDDHMNTSDPNIFAAGDCAVMPWAGRASGPETLRLWEPSRRMGRIAGANIAGGDESYEPWPMYYHTHLFDMPLGFFGSFNAQEEGHERIITETDDGYRELVLKNGKIVGASFFGGRPFPPPFLRLMKLGKMADVDPKELLEDTFDQESLWYL